LEPGQANFCGFAFLWDVTPCSLAEQSAASKGLLFYPEDGVITTARCDIPARRNHSVVQCREFVHLVVICLSELLNEMSNKLDLAGLLNGNSEAAALRCQ
jgi:hypothetical protein